MTIDMTKNPDKMSERELRAEVKYWRGADNEQRAAEIESQNSISEMQAAIENRDTRLNELAEKVVRMSEKAKIVHDEATALLMIGNKK